ncbi:MAG: nicotinamide-nucleotide amidohydrolase family protein [Elusimicrobia bacterium]|nr:nicotinamide-nucleotide amidohydrolase family protein [Elusimicrobiota bacterium]
MKTKKAYLIAVGSELLNSKANRYAPILFSKLSKAGIRLQGEITAKDTIKDIKDAVDFCAKRGNIIIITGGLGPTFDDLTRQAASAFLKEPLTCSKKIINFLKRKYGKRISQENLYNQSLAFKKALLFENERGTAFAQMLNKENKTFIFLPGPMREWEPIWDKKIFPLLKKKGDKIFFSSVRLAGLTECELQEKILPDIKKFKDLDYTVLAGPYICELLFFGSNKNNFLSFKKSVKKTLKNNIYSLKSRNLAQVLKIIFTKKKLTLSLAESCTGGLISSMITSVPGSSVFYLGGVNSYSNLSKTKILSVKKSTLKKYGAVSLECAEEMALGVKKIFGSDFSVSVTGIAGPGGGTKKKPVGTVCFAFCSPNFKYSVSVFFDGDRDFVRMSAANFALFGLLKLIQFYRRRQ